MFYIPGNPRQGLIASPSDESLLSIWEQAASLLDPKQLTYRHDPIKWAEERLKVELWSGQRSILESVRDNLQTAVHSCHEVGKSFIAALTVCWWLDCHPVGEAFVVTTAPTGAQVKSILWREINRMHESAGLHGRTNLTEWYIGNELVALGRKPGEHNMSAFQGQHARFMLVVLDEACHDDKTDVLTENGWMPFADLTGNERLITMDPSTQVAEYQYPTKIIKKYYDGLMHEYTPEKGGNFCVTPDHTMFYQTQKGGWHKRIAQDLPNNGAKIPRSIKWNVPDTKTITIPSIDAQGYWGYGDLTLNFDLWAEFLGWYLSEGSATEHRVTLTQTKPGGLDEIEDLCLMLGFDVNRYDVCLKISDMRLAKYLQQFGKQTVRYVPDHMKKASVRQIDIFLDAYVKGDGYQKGNGQIIYTSSKRMADDLQELVLKTGVQSVAIKRYIGGTVTGNIDGRDITSTSDGWVVTRPGVSTMMKIIKSNINHVPYKGMVYCATVPPHHLIMTRRNGHVMWSGNCGIPVSLWNEASTLTANEHGRTLAIGNPDEIKTEFGVVCHSPSWNVIHIGYRDTPNFTDEPVSQKLKDVLIHPSWVEGRRQHWTEQSPLFQSKCEGVFPVNTVNGIVPLLWIQNCTFNDLPETEPVEGGIDVGAGVDRMVITERRGMRLGRTYEFVDANPMRGVGELVMRINEWGMTRIKIDVIGVGWGICGRLKELSSKHNRVGFLNGETTHHAEIVPVNVANKSRYPNKYVNLRAELWWEIGREYSRLNMWDLANIDEDTINELSVPKYEIVDSNGKIKVESKKAVRARMQGLSPDKADALLLAYYEKHHEIDTADTSTRLTQTDLTRSLNPSVTTSLHGPGVNGGPSSGYRMFGR